MLKFLFKVIHINLLHKIRPFIWSIQWLLAARLSHRSKAAERNGSSPKSLLLLQLNALGDCLMTYPLLRKLRQSHHGVSITVACHEAAMPLFLANPYCDEVVAINTHSFLSEVKDVLRLHKRGFELLFDCTGLLESACMAKIIGVTESIGFDRMVNVGWFTKTTAAYYQRAIPYIEDRYLPHLLESLVDGRHSGMETEKHRMGFQLKPIDLEAADLWHAEHGIRSDRIIILAPGAKWPPRRWPDSYWADLCGLILNRTNFIPILIGSTGDAAMMQRIAYSPAIPQICAPSIPFFVAIMSKASAVICNDSFAMHLAACLNKPTIALFGPRAPETDRPARQAMHCSLFFGVLQPVHPILYRFPMLAGFELSPAVRRASGVPARGSSPAAPARSRGR